MLVLVAVLAGLLFALDFMSVPRVVLFVASIGGVLAIPVLFARICRFNAAG